MRQPLTGEKVALRDENLGRVDAHALEHHIVGRHEQSLAACGTSLAVDDVGLVRDHVLG